MGSELRAQNFDLAKFREIIPRNPHYGPPFFSWNLASEFLKKNLSRWRSSNSAQNFSQIPSRALGLTIFVELHLEEVAPRFEGIMLYKGDRQGGSKP